MISKLTWRILVFATNFLFYVGGSTFLFSSHKSVHKFTIHVYRSRIRTLYNFCSLSVNLVYILFLIYRVFFRRFYHDPNNPFNFNFVMQMIYYLVCYSLPFAFQISMFIRGGFIPVFVHQYLKFFRNTGHRNQLINSRVRVNKLLIVMLVFGVLINLENVLLLLTRPHKAQFLTSILVDPIKKPLYERLPFMILQIWVWLNTWANTYFYVFHIYLYTNCGLNLLREMNPKGNQTFREMERTLKILKDYRILHRMFHHCFRSYFMPVHKGIAICMATCGAFGVIKVTGPRAVVMGFVATISVSYMYTVYRGMGLLFEESSKLKALWLKWARERNKSSKYFKREILAQPELRIEVGSFYFIKRSTVMTLINSIVNFTVNLLLAR